MSRIEQLRRIVDARRHNTVDGSQVDLFTASAIVACYDAGSDKTKQIIETAPLAKVAELSLRFIR